MAEVGIRELKQRLSEYLARAERGEVIRVTDRGRPKAILGPVPGRARIEAGIRAGWITPGTGSPLGPIQRATASRRVLDALAEDRGD
jgi:prevent-host-death family protein